MVRVVHSGRSSDNQGLLLLMFNIDLGADHSAIVLEIADELHGHSTMELWLNQSHCQFYQEFFSHSNSLNWTKLLHHYWNIPPANRGESSKLN